MRRMLAGYSRTAVVAVVAAVLASVATAGAAGLVTGKQIKDGSINTKDLAKSVRKQLAKVGKAGPQGPAGLKGDTGAAGAAGAAGAKGETGPRGFSAWDKIPSGQTVTGTARWDLESPAATGDFQFSVSLPGVAPVALADGTINMAADGSANTTDDDPACTGTSTAPTAPAGKVCVYLRTSLNATNIRGFATNALTDHAFRIVWATSAAGDMYVDVSWAYTAP